MKLKQLSYKRDKDGNPITEVTVINIPGDWAHAAAIRNAVDCLMVGGKATDEQFLQFSHNEVDWADAIVTLTGTKLDNGYSIDVKAKLAAVSVQTLLAFMNETPCQFRVKQIPLPLDTKLDELQELHAATRHHTQEQLLNGEDLPDYDESQP